MGSIISTNRFINVQRKLLSEYFVGRKDELNTLSSLFDEFLLGERNPIVIITGEKGVGKTWLAAKFINTRVIPSGIPFVCVDARSFNSVSSILIWIADLLKQKYKIQTTRFDAALSRLNSFLSSMYSLNSFIEHSKQISSIVDEILALIVPADFMNNVLSVLAKYEFDSLQRDLRNIPIIIDMLLAIALAIDISSALSLLGTNLFLFIDSADKIIKGNPGLELFFSLLNHCMIMMCCINAPRWINDNLNQRSTIIELRRFNKKEIEELAKKYSLSEHVEFISKMSGNLPITAAFIMNYFNEISPEDLSKSNLLESLIRKIVEKSEIELQKILNMLTSSIWINEDILLIANVNPRLIEDIVAMPYVTMRVDNSIPITLHDLFSKMIRKYLRSVFNHSVLDVLRELSTRANLMIACEYFNQAFRFSPATVASDFEKLTDDIIAEGRFIEGKEILSYVPLEPYNFFSIENWINTVLKVARFYEFLLMLNHAEQVLKKAMEFTEFSDVPQNLQIKVVRRLARILAKQGKLDSAEEFLRNVFNLVPDSIDSLKELIRAKELYFFINVLQEDAEEIKKIAESIIEYVNIAFDKFGDEKEKTVQLLDLLGRTLVRISKELIKREKAPIAYSLLKKAKNVFDTIETRDNRFLMTLGEIYRNLGELLMIMGRPREGLNLFSSAIKYYEKYLSYFPDDGSAILELLKAYFNLGEAYSKLMLYSKALETLKKTHEILQKYEDKIHDETFKVKILGDIHRISGEMMLKMMNLDGALQSLKRSVDYYKKILKEREDASVVSNIANALREMSHIFARKFDYDNAIRCLNTALDMLEKYYSRRYEHCIRNEIATLLRTFAEVNMKMANYSDALKKIEEAVSIYKERLKIRPKDIYALGGLADSYRLMSQIYLRIGRFDLSLQYLKKAIEKYQEKLKIKPDIYAQVGLATSLRRLGNMYLKLKQFEKALNSFNEAIRIYQEIIDKVGDEDVYVLDGIATAYRGLADVYVQLNDFEHAYQTLLKSVNIFKKALEKIKDKEDLCIKSGYADALRHLGGVLSDMEKFEEAINVYMEAIKVYHELIRKGISDAHLLTGYATTLKHLGGIYLKQRMFSQAIEYFKRAISVYEKLLEKLKNDVFLLDSYASALRGLGEAYIKRMKYEEALAIFKRTKEIYEAVSRTRPKDVYVLTGLATTYKSLGYIYSKLGKLTEAIEMFKKALNLHLKLIDIVGFKDLGTLKGFINVLWRVQSNKKIALSLRDQILQGINVLMDGAKKLVEQGNLGALELLIDVYMIKSDVLWDSGNWNDAVKLLEDAMNYIEQNKEKIKDMPSLYLKLKYKILFKRARLAYDEKDVETTLNYLETCEKIIDEMEKLRDVDKQTIDLLRNEVDLIRLKTAFYIKYKNLFLLCLERILRRIRAIKNNPIALGKQRRIIFGLIRTLEYIINKRLERFLEEKGEKVKEAWNELKELLEKLT